MTGRQRSWGTPRSPSRPASPVREDPERQEALGLHRGHLVPEDPKDREALASRSAQVDRLVRSFQAVREGLEVRLGQQAQSGRGQRRCVQLDPEVPCFLAAHEDRVPLLVRAGQWLLVALFLHAPRRGRVVRWHRSYLRDRRVP